MEDPRVLRKLQLRCQLEHELALTVIGLLIPAYEAKLELRAISDLEQVAKVIKRTLRSLTVGTPRIAS